MQLTSSKIEENKQTFINLLSSVNRPGIPKLVDWLVNKSDFFTAPSSAQFHGAYEGGLCQHSLNVYYALKASIDSMSSLALEENKLNEISQDTIIIAALLHDLCKTNFYRKVVKHFKDEATNTWHDYYGYEIHDDFPIGHGEKSVIMAQHFIGLTGIEILAIRWHMGFSDPGATISPYEKPALSSAFNTCPLAVLLSNADVFASFMMEKLVNQKVENLIK